MSKPLNKPSQGLRPLQRLVMALEDLLKYADMNTCRHEETHRGGSIWTICDQCGQKWADDEGGMPRYEEPPAIASARKVLSEAKRHKMKLRDAANEHR